MSDDTTAGSTTRVIGRKIRRRRKDVFVLLWDEEVHSYLRLSFSVSKRQRLGSNDHDTKVEDYKQGQDTQVSPTV